MMGPNCLKLLEALMSHAPLPQAARVLDLGCGMGLTSLMLCGEYGAKVFATDLWIDAGENLKRFEAHGCGESIIPIHADANSLPYANGYFDAVVSVDSYHYFGTEPGFFRRRILPLLKPGGVAALTFPGLKRELEAMPDEMKLSWADAEEEVMATFHSPEWWRALLLPDCGDCTLTVGELDASAYRCTGQLRRLGYGKDGRKKGRACSYAAYRLSLIHIYRTHLPLLLCL